MIILKITLFFKKHKNNRRNIYRIAHKNLNETKKKKERKNTVDFLRTRF